MVTTFALLVLLGAESVSAAEATAKSATLFSCGVIHSTTIHCAPGERDCKSEASKKSEKDDEFSLKIAGPESKEPVLIANMGNVMLRPHSQTDATVVMTEMSDVGNLIIYTWFKKTKRLIQTKSYDLLGVDFSVTTLYQCTR